MIDRIQNAKRFHPVPLIVPGLNNSGPDHWQTWLQSRLPGSVRVQQTDWERPDISVWAKAVADTGNALDAPCVIVAHSFGCLASVAAAHAIRRLTGLLLVAPADPHWFMLDNVLASIRIRSPAIVVGSLNDSWMTGPRTRTYASLWAARHVCIGYAGHINTASGYGPWPYVGALIARVGMPNAQRQLACDGVAQPATAVG